MSSSDGTEVFQIVNGPISCHAWNKNGTEIAICPNTPQVHIYGRESGVAGGWKLLHTLAEHDQLVTGLDWCPTTNRIITCSQDRNAYVWNFDAGSSTWRPTLVLLRLSLAATFVRWSPSGNKFAVASASKCVSIGYFEAENDWWVCKHLKKPIKSGVLSLSWHPNEILLALATADCKVHILSAFIKNTDKKPDAADWWGEKIPFGTEIYTGSAAGWVHDVVFSPDGNTVAWTSHDSAVAIFYPQTGFASLICTGSLPLLRLRFLSNSVLIAVGHDCLPIIFAGKDGIPWHKFEALDGPEASSKADGNSSVISSGTASICNRSQAFGGALAKFRKMDSQGHSSHENVNSSSSINSSATCSSNAAADRNGELSTIHQNSITALNLFPSATNQQNKVSTTGLDGRLVIWPVAKSIATAEAALLKVSS